MEFLFTFLEGLASFISPCVLPLLPVYAMYFASGEASRRVVMFRALAFVLGYSAVFVSLGVFAGVLGGFLTSHRSLVRIVCGASMCLFALSALGLFRLPEFVSVSARKIDGFFSAFSFGAIYSLCIMPCAGAYLGAALLTAAAQGGAVKGATLLALYSVGLGVPFFFTAVFLSELKSALNFIKKRTLIINRVCGVALLITGIVYASGLMERKGNDIKDVKTQTEEKEMKMNAAINITSANFDEEVLSSKIPVVIDFWAEWCGPCVMLSKEIEALAAEKAGVIKVCKVNVDEAPDLAARYQITSIPAVFLIRNGATVAKSIGYKSKAELAATLGL